MSSAAVEPPAGPATRPPFADASPAQIRAALIPEEVAEFDEAWRAAMSRATETLDLTVVSDTLEDWRRIARITTANGPEAHRDMYRRAATRVDGLDTPRDEPLRRTKARLGL